MLRSETCSTLVRLFDICHLEWRYRPMDRTGRDNDTWLVQLRGSGPEQQAALRDLRESLIRGLRRALSPPASGDESFLEDAAQDALVRILDRLAQFQGRSRFLTWAISISMRVALTELRRRRWQDVSLDAITAEGAFGSQVAHDRTKRQETDLDRKALLENLHALIASELTDRQRAALVAELRGMPQDEIARQLGSSRNAVYKLTHDARKRLKRAFQAAGYEAADVQSAFGT